MDLWNILIYVRFIGDSREYSLMHPVIRIGEDQSIDTTAWDDSMVYEWQCSWI